MIPGLVDMNFPFNKLEIQMISLLYDPDRDGFINLDDLQTSLNELRSHTGLCTPTIDIYLSSTEQHEHKLQPNTMLTDQQLDGGDEWSPIEIAFYYRPASYLPSDWSPNSGPDFMSVAHDPLLWSKMTLEVARYEERMQRHMSLLSIG
ncbi:hypothetical protein EG68_06296 [Paragonimus skrjabini miyazakii]|uniref:EF-hand domain-containing protein n=1 Tax=Paragonimus skrjabini miyazakii TaxID=59628 RepID=A0A8S9YPI2_9TREM|nr:hypothetical protein EG68_06296 [Paragonimus skrjabini miyazakii]